MRVSLRHFRFFVAVAETGQVSKAAAALFTSQPAVTEAIKALESDIGVKLFNRHPKGVVLTYEGTIFLQHARGVLAAAVDAMLAPQQVRRDMAGEFSLACSHTVAGYFLTPLVARFRRVFPDIRIKLIELDRPEIVRRIETGEIDIAVCLTSPLRDAERIETEVLARSKRRCAGSASVPDGGRSWRRTMPAWPASKPRWSRAVPDPWSATSLAPRLRPCPGLNRHLSGPIETMSTPK